MASRERLRLDGLNREAASDDGTEHRVRQWGSLRVAAHPEAVAPRATSVGDGSCGLAGWYTIAWHEQCQHHAYSTLMGRSWVVRCGWMNDRGGIVCVSAPVLDCQSRALFLGLPPLTRVWGV